MQGEEGKGEPYKLRFPSHLWGGGRNLFSADTEARLYFKVESLILEADAVPQCKLSTSLDYEPLQLHLSSWCPLLSDWSGSEHTWNICSTRKVQEAPPPIPSWGNGNQLQCFIEADF